MSIFLNKKEEKTINIDQFIEICESLNKNKSNNEKSNKIQEIKVKEIIPNESEIVWL